MSQDFHKILEITMEQEALLRFPAFHNRDALALGNFLAERVHARGIELAICIRKVNGNILFQYVTEGTCLNNQNWMNRKFHTVRLMERSSLGAWANSAILGEPVEAHGLSPQEYVFCGGGFPIRLTSGEMVGVITVSNLPHMADHQFIVEALTDWLKAKNVPSVLG